ncbi:MAG: N-acetylmuramoyl-L-alanine amidase [Nitrospirae bacterium YQR-1]
MSINKTLRLQDKEYIKTETKKDLIVVHHTVGATAKSTIEYWATDPQRIGTAYVIERDGEIFEVFDSKYWAYHLGLENSGGLVDKRSIGIELASEGGLIQRNERLYCFGKVSDRTVFKDAFYDNGTPWRGYRFFDAYSEAQITSLIELINQLIVQFNIPKFTPANHVDTDDGYRQFKGILGHHHLRRDKSDVHPGFPWQKVITSCSLQLD